jgi:hypothetical protein
MVVESSFRDTDPHRLGSVVVVWTAARAGTVEPVVSQYKVEAVVAPAAPVAAADGGGVGIVVVAVEEVVVAAAAAAAVASDAVTVGVGVD